MELYTINYIKSNPNLYNFLREDSSWYKLLNRGRENIKIVEEEMKKRYKLTPKDKIEKLSRSVEMISTFMDVLK